MKKSWDYIVVGAGSAGCVIANRLSEDRSVRVLVLEAGGTNVNPLLHVPAGTMRIGDEKKWFYPVEADHSRNEKVETWEGGKVIGGTSSVNGMVWVRGNRWDYDEWAKAGCTGWDYDSVLPYFKRAETFEGGEDAFRGGHGPLHVSMVHATHELTEAFVQAAQEIGVPFNPDYNGAMQEGVGYGQVSQRRGLRDSTASAYLTPARRRRNLRVQTYAYVHRILFDGTKAVGVAYEHNGSLTRARCEREVIVCAGAIASPKLLLLSGIGPADHLRDVGIDVLVDLAGVGHNLQDHLASQMCFEVDVITQNRELTPWRMFRGAIDLLARGRGVATAAFAGAVMFGSMGGESVDYKTTFAPYGLKGTGLRSSGMKHYSMMEVNAVTFRPWLLRPKSRGALALRSSDPHALPRISHEYATHPEDISTLVTASRQIRDLTQTRPMAGHVIREIQPGSDISTDEDWERTTRAICYPGKHPAGTCMMGTGENAVVDNALNVYGLEGLRVADMAIVPTLPAGNTNAAAIMIGERAADLIRNAPSA